MLLDGMETTELLYLLESADALRSMIVEAMGVLEDEYAKMVGSFADAAV